MRIISGIYKSRALQAPKGDQTRPTSDRARETLFNMLVNMTEIDGARVLDLFAGSGAFALEAISRGASSAVCLEKAPQAVSSINLNAMNLGVGTELQIIRSDVYKWLPEAAGLFDVIFADPPYDDPDLPELLPTLIFGSRLLTPDSIVIIEHRSGSTLQIPESAELIRERAAGEANFTFLRLRVSSNASENAESDLSRDV